MCSLVRIAFDCFFFGVLEFSEELFVFLLILSCLVLDSSFSFAFCFYIRLICFRMFFIVSTSAFICVVLDLCVFLVCSLFVWGSLVFLGLLLAFLVRLCLSCSLRSLVFLVPRF